MTDSSSWEGRGARNTIRIVLWMLAWTVTLVLADKAELYEWYSSATASILAITFNAAIGLGLIVTFIRYIRELDELQRKIQLDSLALAVGAGFVGGSSLSLLQTAKLVSDAEISDITLLMVLIYVAGVIVGQIRYR